MLGPCRGVLVATTVVSDRCVLRDIARGRDPQGRERRVGGIGEGLEQPMDAMGSRRDSLRCGVRGLLGMFGVRCPR
jgi:hypothetical protein